MTTALATSDAVATDALDALVANLDADASPAYVEIRSGTRPANVAAAATGTVLVTFTLADPSFTVSGRVATCDTTPDIAATATATDTATWARAYDGADVAVFDGDVGTSGSVWNIDTTSIVSGQTVTLVDGTINAPA